MEVDVFQQKLNSVMSNLQSRIVEYFKNAISNEIITPCKLRIRKSGELASGKKPSYSTKPILIGYPNVDMHKDYYAMYRKVYDVLVKNSKHVTIKNNDLVVVPNGYKQIRDIGGYQTGYVDLTISGDMLDSVKIIEDKIIGNKIIVVYAPTGETEIKKVRSHNSRYKENILMPNEEEVKAFTNNIEIHITNLIKNELFGK